MKVLCLCLLSFASFALAGCGDSTPPPTPATGPAPVTNGPVP